MGGRDTQAEYWDAVYGGAGEAGVSWYQREPRCSLEVLDSLAVRSDASVVDVGGGASTLADALLRRSFTDISVLDISGAALVQAQRRLGEQADHVLWMEQDLLTWRPYRRYDVWHDRAVFHFLTTAPDRRRYIDALHAATQPGSCVILATFAADGPQQCSGLPVNRYTPEDLASVVGSAFVPVLDRREEHLTPTGAVQPFTWVAFTRSA